MYHFFKARKYNLPVAKADQLEKVYALEIQYFRRALLQERLRVPERFYPLTRRHLIFLAFPAGA
jgi:hypothetical protein